jgi:hypothetical protein
MTPQHSFNDLSYDGCQPDNLYLDPDHTPSCPSRPAHKQPHRRRTARRFYCQTCCRVIASSPMPLHDILCCDGRVLNVDRRDWTPEKDHDKAEVLQRDIAEGIELAHSNAPVPSAGGRPQVEDCDPGNLSDGWESGMESYEPRLGVMIKGDLHLDNLPRESPPIVFKEAKRQRKRQPEWSVKDWDIVSVATEDSFYLV